MSNDNTNRDKRRKYTREEVMAKIKELAAKLGRAPKLREFAEATHLHPKTTTRLFGNHYKALQACGLEPEGTGYKFDMTKVFTAWATVVRKLGRIPTVAEYELESGLCARSTTRRFGTWADVPAGMLQHAAENGLKDGWEDALEIARRHCARQTKGPGSPVMTGAMVSKARIIPGRPVYGECFLQSGMAFAPENEMGVVSLFSAMARKLGFVIAWIGSIFPDCEAFREVEPRRWQRVIIEFEFQSRNFLTHGHDPAKCDLIVCWEHNWPESPLEVLELKQAVGRSGE